MTEMATATADRPLTVENFREVEQSVRELAIEDAERRAEFALSRLGIIADNRVRNVVLVEARLSDGTRGLSNCNLSWSEKYWRISVHQREYLTALYAELFAGTRRALLNRYC